MSNSKVKNGNSKLTSLDDARKPSHSTIAPITWTIPKTTPSNPSGNGVSNRRTTDPSGEIIPGCRSVSHSSIFPPSNVSARIAVNRYVSEVIPKIPSKSRSTCVPTAADCDGGGTSGLAPARGDAPSLPHLLPSSFPRDGTAFRSSSKSSWTSISPIGPPRLAELVAVAGFGPGTWHHHRWLAAVGNPPPRGPQAG